MFALEGATVALSDINDAGGKQTESQIKAAGGVCTYTKVNITSEKEVEIWINDTAKQYGQINVLVNNAVAYVFGSVEETKDEDWDRVFAVNVKGHAFCSKFAIPHMRKVGGGSIINIASISSFIAQPLFVPYNTSKGALMQLTRCMALDLGNDKIRVNAVCPGTIETPATLGHAKKLNITLEKLKEQVVQDIFIKRLGHVDDVAFACVFLGSDESTYITGTHLTVDGGVLAR